MVRWSVFIFWGLTFTAFGQKYSTKDIFSHNDYARHKPFYNAYSLEIGYIEADVFLVDNQLRVGHTPLELTKDKTLQRLYLDPIRIKLKENSGTIYSDSTLDLKLMIDVKTEGISTLKELVKVLKSYSDLTNAKTLEFFISGNVPPVTRWNEFPDWIHFDGRPGTSYTNAQLERITLISTNFQNFSNWRGDGEIPSREKQKLDSLILSVHAMNKKIRFWAPPDNENGWRTLMDLKVDVIGTDKVKEALFFIQGSEGLYK